MARRRDACGIWTGVSALPDGRARARTIFVDLPSGRYRIEISKGGFAAAVDWVDVRSGTRSRVPSRWRSALSLLGWMWSPTTPLAGTDLSKTRSRPVQTATAADIEESGALDLADFMNRRLNGVYLNEIAGEPVSARCEFPRLHGFSPARNAGRHFGLSGRRAAESAVRRRGELGSDPQERDLRDYADAGIGPFVRAEHAWAARCRFRPKTA